MSNGRMPLVENTGFPSPRPAQEPPTSAVLRDVCISLQQTAASMQSKIDRLADAHATSESQRRESDARIEQLEALRRKDLEQLLRSHERDETRARTTSRLIDELGGEIEDLRATALEDDARAAIYDLLLRKTDIESLLIEHKRNVEKTQATSRLLEHMRGELDQLRADQLKCDRLGRCLPLSVSPSPRERRTEEKQTKGGVSALDGHRGSPGGGRTAAQRQVLAEVSDAWLSLETTARDLFSGEEPVPSGADLHPQRLGEVSPIVHFRQPLPSELRSEPRSSPRPVTAVTAGAAELQPAKAMEVWDLRTRVQELSAKIEHEATSRMDLKVQCAETRATLETMGARLLLHAPTDPSQQSGDPLEYAGLFDMW